MTEYNPKDIESKWQKEWEKKGIYNTPDTKADKDNEMVLVEFAYPSGNLHAGHWYAFSVMDIYARLRRMLGKNVMFPFGFDAFGLPAENAAIKRNLNPKDWTYDNIAHMRGQLASMGASFDWSREVVTSDPEYYKWTQWLFLQLFKKGLAYRAKSKVNWCPSDKTVLANEQVVDGKCSRCDSVVEEKEMEQWMLRITDYADRLIGDLDKLDWPEPIKQSQRNWIGRSEGAEIEFEVKGEDSKLKVFTTRPDTLFGVTFIAVAGKEDKFTGKYAVHPATGEEIPVWEAEYVMEGVGTGAVMGVPAHDERDWEFAKKNNIPIKQAIARYFEDFTSECKPKEGKNEKSRRAVVVLLKHPTEDKYACLQWKKVNWRTLITGGIEEGEEIEDAVRREIKEETGFINTEGIKIVPQRVVSYFWAPHKEVNMTRDGSMVVASLKNLEQIEISNEEKEKHELIWVPRVELLKFLSYRGDEYDIRDSKFLIEIFDKDKKDQTLFTGEGVIIDSGEFSGLNTAEAREKITEKFGKSKVTYKLHDWVISRQRYWGCPIPIIHCDKCGPQAVPDADLPVLLPEISDFLPTGDGKSPLAKVSGFMNTKCPKCGVEAQRETDTFDTFIDSSWYFLRYSDPNNTDEFANKEKLDKWIPVSFYSGGAEHTTMHLLYSRFFHKALFDLGLVNETEPYTRRMNRGLILGPDGNKMSKSKGNVIDPDKFVEQLGADTVRTYLAFIGPYNETGSYPWNPDSIVGVRRFLERVWRLREKVSPDSDVINPMIMHQTVKKVTEDTGSLKMNTSVSSLMIWVNALERQDMISSDEFEILLKLLAPFAPHISEELWHSLGHKSSIHTEEWPTYDPALIESSEVTLAVQVAGKVRAELSVQRDEDIRHVEKLALALPEIVKRLEGLEVDKVIVVPNKIVNIVPKA